MIDRAFVLLCLLSANERFGRPEVHRTALMKQAYLVETVRPLYRVWRQTFKFVRYHYGPYSEELFQRLDALIFNGLVVVTAFSVDRYRVEARYRIAPAGQVFLERFGANELRDLATDLVWSLQSLGVYQAQKIAKLVYREPEFARMFANHTELGIGSHAKIPLPGITDPNNASLVALATFQALSQPSEMASGNALSKRALLRLFLCHLASSRTEASTAGGTS